MTHNVQITNLTKKFGTFTALDNVNLQIAEGEVFGYIGPNGAGKTTTICTLLGILQATSGEVKVFGMDAWRDATEIHKRIAYVPGDVNLWSNLTGGEVIDLFLNLRGKWDKTKRDRLVEQFDFDPSKKCRTYSKGNRQKVALIAAFASEADLFILDEPTSGLDPLMEQVFRACVLEVKAQGKGVLLSSHIMAEVEKLCDKVAIIRKGTIVESGTLDELRHLSQIMMTVRTERPVVGLVDVHDFVEIDGELTFQVDSDKLGAVVAHLAQFGITKLESAPPTLEDLFMRHYEIGNCGE